jgi:hypothetical protein
MFVCCVVLPAVAEGKVVEAQDLQRGHPRRQGRRALVQQRQCTATTTAHRQGARLKSSHSPDLPTEMSCGLYI